MAIRGKKRVEADALVIRKSNLPGTGKGLFTRTFIAAGQIIVEYKGDIKTYKEIQDNPVLNPYVYLVNEQHVIDAMPFPENLARYVNDAEGLTSMPGLQNNARFMVVNRRVFIEAVTDILPGAEIFVSYGKAYWDDMRLRLASDRKKQNKR